MITPTHKKTQQAIRDSIAHWEQLRNLNPDHYPGAQQCALCKLFYDFAKSEAYHCVGCPIYAKTGERYCKASPFQKAVADYDKVEEWQEELRLNDTDTNRGAMDAAIAEFHRSATVEIEFLKSLLVEPQTKGAK